MPGSALKNECIKQIVLERENADSGIVRGSNYGGWHSTADLRDWPEPEIQELCPFVKDTAKDLTAEMEPLKSSDEVNINPFGSAWVNLLRNSGYNKVHNHPGCMFSAVYYVSEGNPDSNIPDNGTLEFMDPRPGNIHGGKWVVKPKKGILVMFPSWLYHYVNPFYGESDRISIAFNMNVEIVRTVRK